MYRKGYHCDKTKKCLFKCLMYCLIVSSPPIWPCTVHFFLSLFRSIFLSLGVRARRQTCRSLLVMSQKTGAELMNSHGEKMAVNVSINLPGVCLFCAARSRPVSPHHAAMSQVSARGTLCHIESMYMISWSAGCWRAAGWQAGSS